MFRFESDMAKYIVDFLHNKNLRVRSEVLDFDIMGDDNNFIHIVEMKLSFNMKLLTQACNAQKSAHYVYIAIPDIEHKSLTTKKRQIAKRKIEDIELLSRRLGIGLLLVSPNMVRIITEPKLSEFVRPNFVRRIRTEANGRPIDENNGGTTGVKRMTAYYYRSINIAKIFQGNNLTTKQIRHLSEDNDAYSIVYNNYYKWFDNISRGLYCLNEKGQEALSNV